MSRARKPNTSNPSVANADRVSDLAVRQVKGFAKNMSITTGVPENTALWAVTSLVTTEVPKQCASCGELHDDFSSLAFFRRAEVNVVVLWSQCEACQNRVDDLDGDDLDAFNAATEERLLTWADGSVEPHGSVFRFILTEATQDG